MKTLKYRLPQDKALIEHLYWTTAELAKQWDCKYSTAYQWLKRNPQHVILLELQAANGHTKNKRVVPAGLVRT